MTDDTLTLELSPAPDIAAIPNGVTAWPADDGEGVVRMYVVASNGEVTCVNPAPAGPADAATLPPVSLASPGSYGPTTPVSLQSDRVVAAYLGVAHRDLKPGYVIDCAWSQAMGASVGWGEIAILSGPATYGSPSLAIVARGDTAGAMSGTGQVVCLATVTASIPKGTALWGALAAWNPPGSPMPSVFSSVFTAGAALNTIPGWRPSTAGGGAMGWNAWAYAHPPCLSAILP